MNEEVDGQREEESAGEDMQPPPGFKEMIEFVCGRFPEACGEAKSSDTTFIPGMQADEVVDPIPRFKPAHPIKTMMD